MVFVPFVYQPVPVKILHCLVFCTFLTTVVKGQDSPLWKIYYDSTEAYWDRDWSRTATLLEQAEKSARYDIGIYHPNYLSLYNDLGTAYWKAGFHSNAEFVLSRCVALKREVLPPFDQELMLSISNLAAFYIDIGAASRAKGLYKEILDAGPDHIDRDLLTTSARLLVGIYQQENHLDSAKWWVDRLHSWKVIVPNTLTYHAFQLERARLARRQELHPKARELALNVVKALNSSTSQEARVLHVEALQELGVLALQTGDYADAERTLIDAWDRATRIRAGDNLVTQLANNIANVYDRLNIDDKALRFYETSLTSCHSRFSATALPCVTLLNNIAGIRLKRNELQSAIESYEHVVGSFELLLAPSNPLYVTALNNLATAYRKNGNLERAEELLNKALRLLDAYGAQSQDLTATVLNNMAVLKTAQGDYPGAANQYGRAIAIKQTLYGPNSVMLADLVGNLAVTYWAMNKPNDAIPLFKKSIELARRQVTYVFPNLSENEQVQFYKKLKEDFERFNTIAVQWSHLDKDLLSQMLQNRIILKSLQFFTAQRRMKQVESLGDKELLMALEEMRKRRSQLGHLYQQPLRDSDDPEELLKLEHQIDSLEKLVSLKSAETLYINGARPEEIDWKTLVKTLRDDEAIVEIVRFRKYDRKELTSRSEFGFTDSVYYAALVLSSSTKENPALILLRNGDQLENRYYNYCRNALRYSVHDGHSWRVFWQPISAGLAGRKRIYLSADGVFYKLNSNTFLNPSTDRRLIEELEIIHLLNPVQLLEGKSSSKVINRSAVLIGDPLFDPGEEGPRNRDAGFHRFTSLPATQEEIRAINDVLRSKGWTTQLHLREAANEKNLKRVESPGILHVASHGYFSDDVVSLKPEARDAFLFHSGIVLTGATDNFDGTAITSNNDGIVTAFEVMNLDLSGTSLVVLSACETGLGKIENGEGVFGLQRSFMLAGAENVLISLWKVDDDSTRDLMVRFYTHWSGGRPMHDALRAAQLEQAASRPDPAHWGGFILVGHP